MENQTTFASNEDTEDFDKLDSSSVKVTRSYLTKSSVVLVQEKAVVQSIPTHAEVIPSPHYDGVHISPDFIEFTDASEGLTCNQRIHIKNCGTRPAFVRIRPPNSIVFQIKDLKIGTMLSPGLSVSTSVTYSFRRPSLLRAMIPIEINGKILDYRVICTLATERITVKPMSIDFGTIDLGNYSSLQTLRIYNAGGKSTKFSVDVGTNELDIIVRPSRGIVGPYKTVKLYVQVIGTKEGMFYLEFWIKSQPNIRIPLQVNVIAPRLVVYHPNTTGVFTLINFPRIVANTRKFDTFVLRNISSQVSSYIVLGEVDNELKFIRNIDRKEHPVYDAFEIRPVEGRMQPFQGIIFEIGFCPKRAPWQSGKKTKRQEHLKSQTISDLENDFMAFVRIIRVRCSDDVKHIKLDPTKDEPIEESLTQNIMNETYIDESTIFSTSTTQSEQPVIHDVVRLCLHGEMEVVTLNFQPNVLYFGDLYVAEISQRVVTILNPSKIATVTFQYVSRAAVKCLPKSGRLKPESSMDVLVKLEARENSELTFVATADSEDSALPRYPTKIEVGKFTISCNVNVFIKNKEPPPKLVTGITPLITHEVGFMAHRATFGADVEKPRQAMLLAQKNFKRPWASKQLIKSKIISDSLPAYPNDTRKSLNPYIGPPVKSIFTGQPRYVLGPIHPEAISVKKQKFKHQQYIYWKNYVASLREARGNNADADTHFDEIESERIISQLTVIPKKPQLPIAIECNKRVEDPKEMLSKAKAEVLIPLSSVQIYNIRVYPHIFDFGTVAPKSLNYRQVTVENKNEFAVMIHLLSLSKKNISFPKGDTMFLLPGESTSKLVEFRGYDIGKFNGYINYRINYNHIVEHSVIANVVNKQLTLDKREVVVGKDSFDDESYRPQWTIIRISNKFDAKTSFKWEVPKNSPFSIQPIDGAVRGKSNLLALVSYLPDSTKPLSAEAVIKCESGTYSILRMSVPPMAPKAAFINEFTDLGEIPLNLPTRTYGILQNSEAISLFFEVDPLSLIEGLEVNPIRGTIPPHGIAIIEAHFKIAVCMQFVFAVRVTVQRTSRIQWKIKGNVMFPLVRFSPQSIDQRRVSLGTLQSHLITATNFGTTIVKLQFLLQEYPEFTVSLPRGKDRHNISEFGIMIVPGSSQSFYIHFQPVDLASYAFYLPIVINELFGPPVVGNPDSLRSEGYIKSGQAAYVEMGGIVFTDFPARLPVISIDCTVAGHIVVFNKFTFNFSVITKDMKKQLIVRNKETPQTVVLVIETTEFLKDDCPFSIIWSGGAEVTFTPTSIICNLSRGDETSFLVEFKPQIRGSFRLEAPIKIRNESNERLFNRLCLTGEYPKSAIDCVPSDVYFMPVPLHASAEEKVTLKTLHFEKSSIISYKILTPERCNGHFKKHMLNVQFPESNVIPAGLKGEVIMNIVFKSDAFISFCTKIEFWDEEEHVMCPLTVYASADNNLLTTHIYLKTITENQYNHMNYKKEKSGSSLEKIPSINEKSGNDYVNKHYMQDISTTSTSEESAMQLTSTSGMIRSVVSKFQIGQDTNEELEPVDFRRETIRESVMIDEEDEFQRQFRSRETSHVSVEFPIKFLRYSIAKVTYPYFPVTSQSKCNDYEQHMRRTLASAERWLYVNIFKYGFYTSILDGVTASVSLLAPKAQQQKSVKRKSRLFGYSFLDALEILVGQQIQEYIQRPAVLPEDNVDRIEVVLQQYEKTLEFLSNHGACLAHVSEIFLLSYSDYLIITDPVQHALRKKRNQRYYEQFSRHVFESRSKQCWLDVILQTYKCFQFNKIDEIQFKRRLTLQPYGSIVYRDSIISTLSFRRESDNYDKQTQDVFNMLNQDLTRSNRAKAEIILLAWLEYYYEQQQVSDWFVNKKMSLNLCDQQNNTEKRSIKDFGSDLSDGIVLITVTAAYCPFLIDEYFVDLYFHPRSTEEALHNAICLVSAWTKIRLGFIITPTQIVHPSSVQMLMLVAHLFETLPNYIPKHKLKFRCPLAETVTEQVSFSNHTDSAVDYLLLFVGNESGFFSVANNQQRVRINARDSAQVKICFHAKKIKQITAYLLLCGSAYGPQFGKNRTYVLEGNAESLAVSQKLDIRSRIYQVWDNTLIIGVPYHAVTEYEIWMANDLPAKPEMLKMTKWSELRKRKIPRRLFINQDTIKISEGEKTADLFITIACFSPQTRIFSLVFQSAIGDFIIQIQSYCQSSITDRIVIEWKEQEETCICMDEQEFNKDCPFNISIPIHSRNTRLWQCLSTMFQKTLDQEEILFWSRYLDTYTGLRLIHWLMGENDNSTVLEFMHIFNTSVKYSLALLEKDSPLSLPETFTIEDVISPDHTVFLSAHFLHPDQQIYETTLMMTSEDGKELRQYPLSFLRIE